MKDWKTTLSGLVALSPVLLGLFGVHLTPEVANAVTGVGGALVGWQAADKAKKDSGR